MTLSHPSDSHGPRAGFHLAPVDIGDQDLTHLPSPLTPLIGRNDLLATVCGLVRNSESRLVTLTGPGGVGKTRLAISVAADSAPDFAHGAVYIALATVRDAADTLPTIAQRLGVPVADGPLPDLLATILRKRHLLLVLDNMEQLRDAGPSLAELLVECPTLHLVVTSRIALGLAGEQVVPVMPLAVPDQSARAGPDDLEGVASVALFVARARAVDPGFVLDDRNAATVSAICARLDGLPLAIELAAARTAVLSPGELLARLDDRLRVLRGGPIDHAPRLRSMRDAIAWSWDLLEPGERRLLRRLAVFTGGFTLEAAQAVCSASGEDVLDDLTALVRHSLVQRHEGSEGRSRFDMLETIRAFALEHLQASGEQEVLRDRHAAHFAHVVDRLSLTWWPSAEVAGDSANLYAALEWALGRTDPVPVMSLAIGVWLLFEPALGFLLLERAVTRTAETPPELLGRSVLATSAASQFAMFAGNAASARTLLDQAVAMASEAPAEPHVALAWLTNGWVAIGLGDDIQADACARVAERIWAKLHDMGWLGESLILRGAVARSRDEPARAEQFYDQALEYLREFGPPSAVAGALLGLADMILERGGYALAASLVGESLPLIRNHGNDPSLIAGACRTLAAVAVEMGAAHEAARLLSGSLAFEKRIGLVWLPGVREHTDRKIQMSRSRVTAGEFETAWQEGQDASIEDLVDWMTDLASRTGSPGSDAPADALFLTRREQDVLRLVAAGRSNREIADILSISERTVENHMSHILTKLDVESRTAAALVAVRNRIV